MISNLEIEKFIDALSWGDRSWFLSNVFRLENDDKSLADNSKIDAIFRDFRSLIEADEKADPIPFAVNADISAVTKERVRFHMGFIVGFMAAQTGFIGNKGSRSSNFMLGIQYGFVAQRLFTRPKTSTHEIEPEQKNMLTHFAFKQDFEKNSRELLVKLVLEEAYRDKLPTSINAGTLNADIQQQLAVEKRKMELLIQAEQELLDSITISRETVTTKLDQALTDTKKLVDERISSAVTKFVMSAPTQLWKSKYRSAQISFWLSALIVVCLLFAGPFSIWYFQGEILKFVSLKSQLSELAGANFSKPGIDLETSTLLIAGQISRLVFVSVPIIAFFWLVRLVVRFMMRSMILMDDAMARNTMLNTYLHLVDQDQEVVADRPIILEALFRRTPGHGSDTIEAPDLTDILNIKNLAGTKKPKGN